MPFVLTWTGQNGSEQIEVATAADALREWTVRNRDVVKMVIKDNHGRKLTPDDLVELVDISKDATDA